MTKRTRTAVLILLVFLFLLLAPSLIFYSQGYRFDFEKNKIVQIGAFYFKVYPNRADVYINGELQKSTSMITNAAYIENLLPKKYEVEIKKEGYHAWKKTLKIKEKEVTGAENITLFPQNPQFSIADERLPKISFFATSTDKKKIIELNDYEISVIFLGRNEKVFLTRFSEKIENIFWLNDYYLIFNVGDEIKIAEIDDRDSLNVVDLAEFKKPRIVWDKNAKKLHVLSGGKTYLIENLLP